MRYFTADYVFPVSEPPIKNGVVCVDDGRIVAVLPSSSAAHAPSPESFSGILCPGFINTHCHLELSHMKGVIPEKEGLSGFIRSFIAARKTFSAEQVEEGIREGEKEMLQNGIVAVGDICNTIDTFNQKAQQNLAYYNFIEGFDFFPEQMAAAYAGMSKVEAALKQVFPSARSSFVPHAPYSVSELLLRLTGDVEDEPGKIISIHNQESEEENKMFRDKSGKIIELFKAMGMDFSRWQTSGKSSLQSILDHLPKSNNILLVHNTFTNKEDLEFAEAYSKNIYWVTCPNANRYIENTLPDYKLFINAGAKITIGTDSLASNYSLSILDEMKTISSAVADLKLETLMQWATLNGAKALGLQDELGSLEPGKKPGLILIEDVDGTELKQNSKVRRLV